MNHPGEIRNGCAPVLDCHTAHIACKFAEIVSNQAILGNVEMFLFFELQVLCQKAKMFVLTLVNLQSLHKLTFFVSRISIFSFTFDLEVSGGQWCKI